MGFLSAISAGLGIASTIGGAFLDDSDDVEREQRELIGQARGLYGEGRSALQGAETLALEDIDAANLLLADLDDEVLGELDESMRIAIGRQMMQEEQQRVELEQRAATAGLDASTVLPGLQRGQSYAQAQNLGAVHSQFAGQRANALMGVRGMQTQGLLAKANARQGFASQVANLYAQEAGFVGGIQVQGSNQGAALGQIGGSIANSLSQYAMIQALGGGT